MKLKNVKGALVSLPNSPKGEYAIGFCEGLHYREKLAAIVYDCKIKKYRVPSQKVIFETTAKSYRYADAIIAALHDLLEVEEGK